MSGYSKDTCTPLYCSIIHENLAVEPYTDEWIKKMWWCIY
jgi:hypothetical protein